MSLYGTPSERTTRKNRASDQNASNVQEYTAAMAQQEVEPDREAGKAIASVQNTEELQ